MGGGEGIEGLAGDKEKRGQTCVFVHNKLRERVLASARMSNGKRENNVPYRIKGTVHWCLFGDDVGGHGIVSGIRTVELKTSITSS